jgi:chromate transporter
MRLFFELFLVFFKIGTFTIGGGFAMIPVIKTELVDKKKWVKESDFIDILAVVQSSPGPIAVNTAVFLGLKIQGIWGMAAASLGAVLPSFIIILLVAVLFQGIQNNPYFIAAFKGIKPAVVALILVPVFSLAKKAGVGGWKFILPIAIALLVAYAHVSPILFIVAAMVLGNLYGMRKKS